MSEIVPGEEWLADFRQEESQRKKLGEHGAHTMLVDEFRTRLASIKADDPSYRPWVVPFCYTHDDAENRTALKGALWIPDIEVQRMVDDAGYFIHYALIENLEERVELTGINLSSPLIQSRMITETPLPLVHIHTQSYLATAHALQSKIEDDFEVVINHF